MLEGQYNDGQYRCQRRPIVIWLHASSVAYFIIIESPGQDYYFKTHLPTCLIVEYDDQFYIPV
jgi:hypothetical protein